jgi:succinate-semialdehyde dehydrogenase/glutarate-semialdehyde dehydrogenase
MLLDQTNQGNPVTEFRYDDLFLFIDGQWIGSSARETKAVINPATEAKIGELPMATVEDLSRAIHAAHRAFQMWRAVAPLERSAILRRGAAIMRERLEAIAAQMTLEQGKPLAEARRELLQSAEVFEWFAEEGRRAYGRIIPSRDRNMRYMALQEPVGPVVAFAPWNFPASTGARKMAASLAAGCSCIIKPAEETPATALAMARALDEAGLPKGVLQVVFGEPAQVSETLLGSALIRKMSFTGSTAIGKYLSRLASNHMIRTTMELGGHAPVVVCNDADLDQLVSATIATKFRNAGQICVSPTRFFVQNGVHDRFVEKFAAAAEKVRVGSGLDPATQMGPLANARRLAAMDRIVAEAVEDGATLVTGGARAGNLGYFWKPTVLANVPESARVMREEPFGPVALTHAFNDFDEVVAKANGVPFGLAAYVFTRNGNAAVKLSERLESGMVGINTFNISVAETPFGGVKESGHGSEGGIEGLQAYMATKFVSEMYPGSI